MDNTYIYLPDRRAAHRVICRQAWGAFPRSWVVHHIDGNKKNNVPDNLIAMPTRLHSKIHDRQRKEKIQFTREELVKMVRMCGSTKATIVININR